MVDGRVSAPRIRASRIDFAPLRRELELPTEFPLAALREAEEASRTEHGDGRVDRTDLAFVTVDPPGARDLDQAVRLEQRAGGYRVYYAIADVFAFVVPGGALDAETHRRGQTVYLPDGKVPLHPPVLSEGAASLLPDRVRPAVLWTVDLDAGGVPTSHSVERALVRSRAQYAYPDLERELPEPVALLPTVGKLLIARGLERGAVDLPLPDQEIEPDGDGWRLELRSPLPVEEWNAQISLLTGMVAAKIMLTGGTGLLRTMPPPPEKAITRLRAAAAALDIDWPAEQPVGELLAAMRPVHARELAFVEQAGDLLSGATYEVPDGSSTGKNEHSAVAAPYAHVTAPLRRLADRYATEACLALHDGREVPAHVRSALPELPATMQRTARVTNAADRAAVDLVEAVLLAGRVGEVFEAAVLDVEGRRGTIALDEPAVRARCDGDLALGTRTRVRLVEADPATRKVRFETAG
ncbi:RNB domain-containing ribonuclease [Virgisporangium aliadipatigenens]|uniref:RNB domain-containing ribonuclease n=1 Tax=Virgisporangium aliadipatigenens TaxID=741659 RepID=UPI001EF303AB|nr:RNB domain-containing ribonuclease [Virgisporangium aliadipatigenens]